MPYVIVPISLVNTFFIVCLTKFSVGILSVLTMILSIKLIISSTVIVARGVCIQVRRNVTPGRTNVRKTGRVFFTIVSAAVALMTIFFPVIFVSNVAKQLFQRFDLIVSKSIVVSSFTTLAFAPVLTAGLLVGHRGRG